jgi:hypothetical protein
MVLVVEPLIIPSFERRFQGKDEKILMRSGLNANATHHLMFGGAWLIFQEEIMFEKNWQ